MYMRYYREKGGKILRSEMILSKVEQSIWYRDCLQRVFNNPRWYLDNLEYLPEFQVGWKNYGRKHWHRDWQRRKKACNNDTK